MSEAKKAKDDLLKPQDNHASDADTGTGTATTQDNHASGGGITTLDNHASAPTPK
ncbi:MULTISPECIES: sigma-like protein [Streptomyces]|uniref:sigma-like protein n=1 Tax=Streptomyces TaxID=1883 RepID=UPI0023AF5C6D|nr:sigma-like protein [Streptomyces sp. KA12]MDF0370713.1 sigma-like protein [Streptomyces sp. KA12]